MSTPNFVARERMWPHTSSMLLKIGWAMLGIEVFLAIIFGLILGFIWSRSAMDRSTARFAMTVYVFGCVACILFSALLPL